MKYFNIPRPKLCVYLVTYLFSHGDKRRLRVLAYQARALLLCETQLLLLGTNF